MKTNLFKVRNVLSVTAMSMLLASSLHAQEKINFEKQIKMDYETTRRLIADKKVKVEDKVDVKKSEKKISAATEQELAYELEQKNKLPRQKVKAISTIKASGIKIIKPKIEAPELITKKLVPTVEKAVEKTKEKTISKATEAELAADLENKSKLKEKEIIKEEKKETAASSSLINLICKQQTQIEKMQENFSTFQQSISQNMLSMQQLTNQLIMLNNAKFTKSDSVHDRYEHMYPFYMMQQMQHQMQMQQMMNMFTTNYSAIMAPVYQNYGQQNDAKLNYATKQTASLPGQFAFNFDAQRSIDILNKTQASFDSKNVQNLLTPKRPFVKPLATNLKPAGLAPLTTSPLTSELITPKLTTPTSTEKVTTPSADGLDG